MSKNITIIDSQYKEWIADLSKRYRQSQVKAAVKVNTEMLRFYWSLGRDIVKYSLDNKYGSQFYGVLSNDLRRELPDVSGLSERNLRYMKEFYLLYSQENKILPQAMAKSEETAVVPWIEDLFQVPWGQTFNRSASKIRQEEKEKGIPIGCFFIMPQKTHGAIYFTVKLRR